MKQIKICILQTEWPCWKTLKTYSKMTPGGKGVWGNLVGVPTIKEADLAVVVDYTIHALPKGMPVVYMGAHPPPCPGYRCYDEKDAVAKFDLRDTYGFGEWWIDWSYDELMALKRPEKTKSLSCILSNKTMMKEHLRRREFVTELVAEDSTVLDLYGRIVPTQSEAILQSVHKGPLGEPKADMANQKNHWGGKTPALLPYKYSLEFDYFCECPHYFSERVYDALLLWTLPIYSGGKGIGNYLPKGAIYPFHSFDTPPEEIVKIINSGYYEEHIKDIEEARHLLLNKFHLWARTAEGVKGKL